MPTRLKEISTSLGLSPATVSRALNGFPEVSEKTRARIVEAARRLDYKPNQIARKLVSGRSGMVGLVIRKPSTMATDTTFFGVVTGISAALAKHDVDLVLHVALDDDEVEPYRRLVSKGTLDGFILSGPRANDPRIAYLKGQGASFVVHGRSDHADYPYYDLDNAQVSAVSTNLLCDLGHRRIALINGPSEHAYTADRLRGFVDTLSVRGLMTPEAFIMHGPLSDTHGYVSALRALSGTRGPAPTAFVCASTPTAVGVMRAIADRGLRVPQDVSVVAHDDDVPQLEAASLTPPLTVTSSPLTNACEPLAEILLAHIKGKSTVPSLQRTASPELIIRSSAASPPISGLTPWSTT